jgi:tetratricopeptide (TPR) repeat protein
VEEYMQAGGAVPEEEGLLVLGLAVEKIERFGDDFIVEALDWTGTGEAALAFFHMPGTAEVATPHIWFKLGLLLFDGGSYPESLEAFRKCRGLSESKGDLFGALVWMGHLNDLLGKRDEAVACYAEALKNDTGRTMQHDQYQLRIDKAWVRQTQPLHVEDSPVSAPDRRGLNPRA